MILVKPSFKVLTKFSPSSLELIELAGRTCYKSEDRVTPGSAEKFVSNILRLGHESVIEHLSVTVKLIVDRGVTHELVRHRLASYSQESTRYCNYKGGMTFVIPPWVSIEEGEYNGDRSVKFSKPDLHWFCEMLNAETAYLKLVSDFGWSPQQARSVLPNSLKTEIVTTANVREWRHIFKLRCSKAAHPQMREIMIPLLKQFQQVPILFDDLEAEE